MKDKKLLKLTTALLLTFLGSAGLLLVASEQNSAAFEQQVFARLVQTQGGPSERVRADQTASQALPFYGRWKSFTTRDGLPSNKVFCVRVAGSRVWAGTEHGLAVYENGEWSVFGVEDGLPHRAVLSLDVSPMTGDLWIGTMGGMARYSGGRFDVYDQLGSGLSNDFVNEVQCEPDENVVWAATAMGLSRLSVAKGSWEIYTHENTPMHEPWTYSVAIGRGLVYVGAWGAGILELEKSSGRWRVFRDPDKEMEIDLLPNDGPVHDVTSAIDFDAGVLWQSTYMGLSRYDGLRWSSYYKEDSGLASNFINFVKARGEQAWLCTDDGLSITDGSEWVTYRTVDGRGEVSRLSISGGKTIRRLASGPAHNFILGIDFQGEDVWLATEGGVSHGFLEKGEFP